MDKLLFKRKDINQNFYIKTEIKFDKNQCEEVHQTL
jgi:hypothetical protein